MDVQIDTAAAASPQNSTLPRSESASLAALRAGQEERIRKALEYRRTVGDPVEILTTLLPLSESDIAAMDDALDGAE